MQSHNLKLCSFDTKLGEMIAIGDEAYLYLLQFRDETNLEAEMHRWKAFFKINIEKGLTPPMKSVQKELKNYFQGKLKVFKTPLYLVGTPFQKQVWEELLRTPYGKTRSYANQAQAIGKCSAFRAVANANGANHLVIVVPCHRVINTNGKWGGFSSGLERKIWLIQHEMSHI